MADEKAPNFETPKFKKGKFVVNYARAISEFQNAMQSFPLKKILYQSAFQGKGLEFDSYKEFNYGDDAELIDWTASLRADKLLSRKYIQERDLNIYFLVDVSNSVLFGSGKRLKAEYIAEFVVSLAHLIVSSGDRVGLILFNEGIVKILRPVNSRTQLSLFMKYLENPDLYGGGFDLDLAIDHALHNISSEYTVFILVSDFVRVRKTVEKNLRLMGSKFETMAIIVRDPMDEVIPASTYQMTIQDPYSNRQMVVDSSLMRKNYELSARKQKGVLKDLFKLSKIDILELYTDKHFSISVANFLKARSSGGRI